MKESNKVIRRVFWYEGAAPHADKCQANASFDVVIVGGGIAGLMCAHELVQKKSELTIAIVEADWCGGGASGKSSGFITPDSELELLNLTDAFGIETAKRLWEFAKGGVAAIRTAIKTYGIDCDYQEQNSLFIARNEKAYKHKIIPEHESQQAGGYKSVLHTKESLKSKIGSDSYTGAVEYSETFGMKSFSFCQAMKKVLQDKDVKVFEISPVEKIAPNQVHIKGSAGNPGPVLTAKNIVIATDRFLPDLGIAKKDIYHAQTFLSISKPLSEEAVARMFPSGPLMVWDSDLIYQYFRVTGNPGDRRLLLGAANVLYTYSENERNPAPERILRKMNNYLKKVFPREKIEIEYLWPGLIGVSRDFVPIAGVHKDIPGMYFLGGAAGLPWATALGIYTAKKILDPLDQSAQQFDNIFNPERHYPVGNLLQAFISKPISFAISHSIKKYFS